MGEPCGSSQLRHLATPEEPPWSTRRVPVQDDDPRDAFNRDRDRIVHSAAFHRLQHKTQVYLIHEGDFYRTRLTHTLEVAQISRTMARLLGLSEPLAEAIALAHDLGHSPFGHAGEQALDQCLKKAGDPAGWDSNRHSLTVVDEMEFVYPDAPGLNLTYATRQGIARHKTPFDRPVLDFDRYPQPIAEAQVVNLADVIAYAGHDVQDALEVGLLKPETMLDEHALRLWRECWDRAVKEFETHGTAGGLSHAERNRLLARRARRHLIDKTVKEAVAHTRELSMEYGIHSHEDVLYCRTPVVMLPGETGRAVEEMVRYLFEHVYSSPFVERQNEKERWVLTRIFERLYENNRLLPEGVQRRVAQAEPGQRAREIACYLASLTDRGALDLYAELFDPRDRVLGHHRAWE
ncbi:MAG TPA: dNTP triphosphohydrolase [Firmicutes bacterium]|nr:dNTP triphosphohydrolase [Bacillota bacterium]